MHESRFAVASPLTSYLPYVNAVWLGQDLVQGIEWALANREEVLARIRRGQALVAERFAVDTIERQWRELFECILGSRDS